MKRMWNEAQVGPSRVAGRRKWGRPPVAVVRGSYLGTRYPDQHLVAMAGEDGQFLLSTQAWGDNRELHGEQAVLQAAVTHAVAVRQWLDTTLGEVGESHARALQKFNTGLVSARTAQTAVAVEAAQLALLRAKLADRGLEPPTSPWKVTALLTILGVGDLTMTSVALMVLNISDRPYVNWLPVSALQVAAVPVVFGMLTAAHFLGESIKAHRYEPTLHPAIKIIGGAALGGGLCLALSVAAIRTAFLTANGVAALSLPFIGIQLGLFAVAVAASAWVAHPYRAEWRRAARAVRHAIRRYQAKRRSAGRLAGIVNALVRRHRSLVAQGVDGAEAVLSDGIRQGHLYRRGHQHALPEPAAEKLHPDPVSQRELPGPVTELLRDYPDVKPDSNLAPLEPTTLDELDTIWAGLHKQVNAVPQDQERPGHKPTAARGPLPLNGAAQTPAARRAPAEGNGTSRAGVS